MLANAASGRGQRVVENDGFERIFDAFFPAEFEESRNIHSQGTAVFARGERQLLADTCTTSVLEDVIFVFFAEVSNRGEDWIRRGLAQPAKRTLANHTGEFVQKCKIFPAARALSE
jgi:hypothetical protein